MAVAPPLELTLQKPLPLARELASRLLVACLCGHRNPRGPGASGPSAGPSLATGGPRGWREHSTALRGGKLGLRQGGKLGLGHDSMQLLHNFSRDRVSHDAGLLRRIFGTWPGLSDQLSA